MKRTKVSLQKAIERTVALQKKAKEESEKLRLEAEKKEEQRV